MNVLPAQVSYGQFKFAWGTIPEHAQRHTCAHDHCKGFCLIIVIINPYLIDITQSEDQSNCLHCSIIGVVFEHKTESKRIP